MLVRPGMRRLFFPWKTNKKRLASLVRLMINIRFVLIHLFSSQLKELLSSSVEEVQNRLACRYLSSSAGSVLASQSPHLTL